MNFATLGANLQCKNPDIFSPAEKIRGGSIFSGSLRTATRIRRIKIKSPDAAAAGVRRRRESELAVGHFYFIENSASALPTAV